MTAPKAIRSGSVRPGNGHAAAPSVTARTILVTGTGTGVGKTVLSTLLVRRLLHHQRLVRAFKPVCSGGRSDARALWWAQQRNIPLDVVNPWWFAAPVTPRLAAQKAGVSLRLAAVESHLRRHAVPAGLTLVEGAGGLLSPLGEDFDTRALLLALAARPVVVAVNRLGVLNDAWLTWEALPEPQRAQSIWVLFDPAKPDASTADNQAMLAERIHPDRIHSLPRCAPAQRRHPRADLGLRLDALIAQLYA